MGKKRIRKKKVKNNTITLKDGTRIILPNLQYDMTRMGTKIADKDKKKKSRAKIKQELKKEVENDLY